MNVGGGHGMDVRTDICMLIIVVMFVFNAKLIILEYIY